MGLKQDEDFLRFLTMGAEGSAAVAQHLNEEHGHQMVELERYTMANKIWATKVKRLRLPDLLCVRCGLRVEARAKSNLEITMSDSDTAGREWHAGLRDEDVVAFVYWAAEEGRASRRPQYFRVGALHAASASSKEGSRKAVSEGSEWARTWTARVPKQGGVVTEVAEDERKVIVTLENGRRQQYSLPDEVPAFAYVEVGEEFNGLEQFLLGIVALSDDLDCSAAAWHYPDDLEAEDPVARYSAVKAAGIWRDANSTARLEAIARTDDDARIRLEALASLARINPDAWTSAVADAAADRGSNPSLSMEAIFILSELGTDAAVEALSTLANDREQDSEARSAAAWGLGETGARRSDLLLGLIADEDDDVALHALAAIGDLSAELIEQVQDQLRGSDREAASAMELLVRQGEAGARTLLEAAAGDDAGRTWALAGLGQMKPATVRAAAAGDLPADIEALVEPMWARNNRSWLNRAEPDDSLTFLQRQSLRHKPPDVGEAP